MTTLTLDMYLSSNRDRDQPSSDDRSNRRKRQFQETMISPENSILSTEPPSKELRPYSQLELRNMQNGFLHSIGISDVYAHHENCDHSYYVKLNGKKYKLIKEHNNNDVGTCSVCWQLRRTPRELKDQANLFIELYREEFPDLKCDRLTLSRFQIEKIFYTWLYLERF